MGGGGGGGGVNDIVQRYQDLEVYMYVHFRHL